MPNTEADWWNWAKDTLPDYRTKEGIIKLRWDYGKSYLGLVEKMEGLGGFRVFRGEFSTEKSQQSVNLRIIRLFISET